MKRMKERAEDKWVIDIEDLERIEVSLRIAKSAFTGEFENTLEYSNPVNVADIFREVVKYFPEAVEYLGTPYIYSIVIYFRVYKSGEGSPNVKLTNLVKEIAGDFISQTNLPITIEYGGVIAIHDKDCSGNLTIYDIKRELERIL